MRHHLKIIAKNFNLNQKELEEFALKTPRKYGIDNENGFISTSTFYTIDLVNDFKNKNI